MVFCIFNHTTHSVISTNQDISGLALCKDLWCIMLYNNVLWKTMICHYTTVFPNKLRLEFIFIYLSSI